MVHGRQQPIARRRRRRWQRRRGNFKRPVLLFGVCALGNGGQPSRGTTPLPFLAPSSERSIYAIRLFVACRQWEKRSPLYGARIYLRDANGAIVNTLATII